MILRYHGFIQMVSDIPALCDAVFMDPDTELLYMALCENGFIASFVPLEHQVEITTSLVRNAASMLVTAGTPEMFVFFDPDDDCEQTGTRNQLAPIINARLNRYKHLPFTYAELAFFARSEDLRGGLMVADHNQKNYWKLLFGKNGYVGEPHQYSLRERIKRTGIAMGADSFMPHSQAYHSSGAPMAAAAAPMPALGGLDPEDHIQESIDDEDDLLDIPRFLRRQAN